MPRCGTLRGGEYNKSASSTAGEAAGASIDLSDTYNQVPEYTWASDKFWLGDVALANYTFGVPGVNFGGGYDNQNNIGLGSNSTFLRALQDAGITSSNSWSWYFGQNAATSPAQRDGQIVFGGYNAAKATGPKMTKRLEMPNPDCYTGMVSTATPPLRHDDEYDRIPRHILIILCAGVVR